MLPERIAWTLGQLHAITSQRVLEIGCGNGLAAEQLLLEHPRCRLHAIDRSGTAVAASRRRLASWLAKGRATVSRAALADLDTGKVRFDRAFAINVNLFWSGPADELSVFQRVLKPGGSLLLVYEPPTPSQLARITESCRERLTAAGFRRIGIVRPRLRATQLVAIRAVSAEQASACRI